jgi:hypothetical protein
MASMAIRILLVRGWLERVNGIQIRSNELASRVDRA